MHKDTPGPKKMNLADKETINFHRDKKKVVDSNVGLVNRT